MIDITDLYRERDSLHAHTGNVARMADAYRHNVGGYTPAVRRMTLAATRNAVEAYLKTLDALEDEVLPVCSLPAVVSVGSL